MGNDSSKVKQHFYFHNMQNSDVFELSDNMVFGRDKSADIQFHDDSISSKHLKVFLKDNHIYILDLGSSNGTKVNSINISSDKDVRLRVGDNVTIGKVSMQLSRKSKPLTGESNFSLITSREEIFNSSNYKDSVGQIDLMITGREDTIEDNEIDELEQMVKDLELLTNCEKELGEKIEKLINKNKQKEYLISQLDKFDKDNQSRLNGCSELDEYYENNHGKYQEILAEIPTLEARLTLLKMSARQMSNKFDERAELKTFEKKRSKYLLELKDINRLKVDEKIELARTKVRKTRIRIEEQKYEIENYKNRKRIEKEQENEKIASEIKKLQKKLGNAS